MLGFMTIALAIAILFHLLRRRQDGQVACDDGTAVEAEVIGKHVSFEGAAVGDEENLFEVLAEERAGDGVDEGLSAGTVEVAEWFVEDEEARGDGEFAREGGYGKGQAQGQGELIGCTAREGRGGDVGGGCTVPDAQLEGPVADAVRYLSLEQRFQLCAGPYIFRLARLRTLSGGQVKADIVVTACGKYRKNVLQIIFGV